MPRWFTTLAAAIAFAVPLGTILLTIWPLTRLSGRLFVAELDLITLACLTAGLSILLAHAATAPKNADRWTHR